MSHAYIKVLTEAFTAPRQPDYDYVARRCGRTVNGVHTVASPVIGGSPGDVRLGRQSDLGTRGPTIDSVVADSDTITITMAPYPQGDGTWSAVYEYRSSAAIWIR